jgi:hypothetical protein
MVLEGVSVVPETSYGPLGMVHLVAITGSEPPARPFSDRQEKP